MLRAGAALLLVVLLLPAGSARPCPDEVCGGALTAARSAPASSPGPAPDGSALALVGALGLAGVGVAGIAAACMLARRA